MGNNKSKLDLFTPVAGIEHPEEKEQRSFCWRDYGNKY